VRKGIVRRSCGFDIPAQHEHELGASSMTSLEASLKAVEPGALGGLGSGSPLSNCRLFDLPIIEDHRGNLTFIEGEKHVPFPIERVYYLYDVPGGAQRAGHAHRQLEQFLVAISGSFDIVLSDGRNVCRIHLNRSYFGLYIAPMVWRELDNFSSGSVCMALASAPFDEGDYYRDRGPYLKDLEAAAR